MAIKVTGCHRWAVSSGKSPTPLGLSSLLSQGCHEAAVSKEWTVLGLAGAGRPERPLRVVTEGHDVSVDEAGVCTGSGARREAQPGHSGAAARAGDSGRHFRCVLAETKAGLGKARLKTGWGYSVVPKTTKLWVDKLGFDFYPNPNHLTPLMLGDFLVWARCLHTLSHLFLKLA